MSLIGSPGLVRRLPNLVAAACLLFSVLSTFHFMGSSSLVPRGDVPVQPVGHVDYSLQYYYANLGARFLHDAGVPYGYDPRFMSGYVKSPAYYPSSIPFEVSVYVFQHIPPAIVFNWTVFVLLAALPFFMYRAAANFGFDAWDRAALMVLLVAPEAFEPHLGLFAVMRAAGMVAFITASFMSVYVVSVAYRFLTTGRWSSFTALLVAAPILFVVHPTAPLVTVVPLVVLYGWRFRHLSIARHVALFFAAAAAVAVAWFWIEATLTFRHYSDLHAFDDNEAVGHFAVVGGSLLGPLRTFLQSTEMLGRLPLVLGPIGLFLWWKERRTGWVLVIGLPIFAVGLMTYYGHLLGLNSLSPGRFTLPLALYLFFPTAYAVVRAGRALSQEWREGLTRQQGRIAGCVLLAVVPSVLPAAFVRRALFEDTNLPEMQTRSGYSGRAPELIDWLETNTDGDGRILHEETSRFSRQYYGTYLAALFALHMDREFANGPAPYPLVQQNVLRFMAGNVQERPLAEMDPVELAELLARYNVRWVLCWTDSAREYFSTVYPASVSVGVFESFELFRLQGNPGYFARGSGRVTSAPNLLAVTDAVADGGELVLRYHWDEHFWSVPPVEIHPVPVPGDPVPFIGVSNPPPSFRLVFDY